MQNVPFDSTMIGFPSLLAGSAVGPDPETIVYSPHLLLDTSLLDRGIVLHPDYTQACGSGFTCFLDELYHTDDHSQQEVWCFPTYTLQQVTVMLLNELSKTVESLTRYPHATDITDGWSMGFCVGWLSALALYQPVEARAGLLVLAGITASEYGASQLHQLRRPR